MHKNRTSQTDSSQLVLAQAQAHVENTLGLRGAGYRLACQPKHQGQHSPKKRLGKTRAALAHP